MRFKHKHEAVRFALDLIGENGFSVSDLEAATAARGYSLPPVAVCDVVFSAAASKVVAPGQPSWGVDRDQLGALSALIAKIRDEQEAEQVTSAKRGRKVMGETADATARAK